jgi:hypothetical protein
LPEEGANEPEEGANEPEDSKIFDIHFLADIIF